MFDQRRERRSRLCPVVDCRAAAPSAAGLTVCWHTRLPTLQTATAAAQTLAHPPQAFAPVPPSPLRPMQVSKERLSLKGQVGAALLRCCGHVAAGAWWHMGHCPGVMASAASAVALHAGTMSPVAMRHASTRRACAVTHVAGHL